MELRYFLIKNILKASPSGLYNESLQSILFMRERTLHTDVLLIRFYLILIIIQYLRFYFML